MKSRECTRRGFFSPGALETATGGLPSLFLGLNAAPPVASQRTRKHLRVARRAMACDFSLLFPAGQRRAVEAGCAALDEIERLEAKLSVYRADSDISYINRHACEEAVRADAEVFGLLQLAAELTQATEGAFDIATGALTKVWGFFDGARRVPGEEQLRAAMGATGMRHLELDSEQRTVRFRRAGVEVNLGSLGKGYAIDRALERIRTEFGVRSALMQGGQSSVRALGTPAGEPQGWKVAIGNPYRPGGKPIATVYLRHRALGTSGSAFQYFEENGRRYGHVLDPRTGWPASQVASASVLAPTAAEADALSTAFFVLGLEATRRYCSRRPEVAAVLVIGADSGRRPQVIAIGVKTEAPGAQSRMPSSI
jgi:thiamine biosynthesis lipoprotein